MEYWNDLITQKSWEKLQELAKQFNIVVIGGWAIYLWTKQHKSKDIDVIVDFKTLEQLKTNFQLNKNNRLKKLEIKMEQFDVDIYAPHYSTLELPVERLLENYLANVEGFKTITPEALLVLKQGAEKHRRDTPKGKKDAIDIASLLIYATDIDKYVLLLKKEDKLHLLKELETAINSLDNKDSIYLGKNFNEFAKWKRETLNKIRKLK